jgi:site-specific recombinase XerD
MIFPDMKQQNVRDWYRHLAKKAGLPPDKHYSHILRRSRATHLLADGASITEIQWVLGHKSPQTTIIYLGITEEAQAHARKLAVAGIDRLLG